MKISFDLKRKSLGLLCILWSVGLTFLLGVMEEGLVGGITIFLSRSVYIFIIPPYAIWMLPCLLTGIYQLCIRQQEKFDKAIFYIGLILSTIGLLFFFLTKYNPTIPHEHSALGLIAGGGWLVFLSGMWNIKIRKKSFLKIRLVLTVLIIFFILVASYSAVYGRPISTDPVLLYFIKGNTYEDPGWSSVLELEFIGPGSEPIQYMEVCLTPSYVPRGGPPEYCSYTNDKGITVFKVRPEKYKVGFNFVNFPEKFTIPEKNIWIELKEGETIEKVIKLETK